MDLRGVILAGGTGSRLMPLTKVTNKHLLPVGQKPMIYYLIEKLTSIGVEQILIVTDLSRQSWDGVSFEEGIKKTIDWYLQNQKWLANVVSGDYQKYYDAMYSNR